MEHHQNDHQNYEMPIVSQSNIDVGSNESGDEVVVEAKRRRKSPPSLFKLGKIYSWITKLIKTVSLDSD